MFVRVREFISQRLNDFSETGVARQLFAQLQVVITALDAHAAAQATGAGQARHRTHTRGSARLALRELMDAIRGVAKSMGVEKQFPSPDRNDGNLLHVARSYATNAVPLKAEFIAHEMPADFLDELQTGITAFETEIAEQGNAVGDHVQAREAIDALIEEGMEIVRKLDGIVRAKYAISRAILAEWTSASHTERAPRRSNVAPPPSPGPTPPAA